MPKTDYINEINKLLANADIELLDFVFQFLQQSIEKPVTLSEELQPA